MRQYDMVFGILLILSITEFTLAAPIPVQEKRQTSVYVVHIPGPPRDLITVLEKRGGEEVEKLAEYFEKWGLGDPHASSSSAPPGHEHGSMNDEQVPGPNTPPSTANLPVDPLVEPSSPLSTDPSIYSPTPSHYGSDDEFWAHWLTSEGPGQIDDVQQPNPELLPQESGVANEHGLPPQENGVANGHQVVGAEQPDPGLPPQANGAANGDHMANGEADGHMANGVANRWHMANGVANGHMANGVANGWHMANGVANGNMANGVAHGDHIYPGLPPQVNGVAHGQQVEGVQLPNPELLPQENGMANGHQVGPEPLNPGPSNPGPSTGLLADVDWNFFPPGDSSRPMPRSSVADRAA